MGEAGDEAITKDEADQLDMLMDVKREVMATLWGLQDPDDAAWVDGSRYSNLQTMISGLYYTAEEIFREAESLRNNPIKGV